MRCIYNMVKKVWFVGTGANASIKTPRKVVRPEVMRERPISSIELLALWKLVPCFSTKEWVMCEEKSIAIPTTEE